MVVFRLVRAVLVAGVGVERCSSLSRFLVKRRRPIGVVVPVAHVLKGGGAARGLVAPLGAKGSARLSMCQIASDSRRVDLGGLCAALLADPRRRLLVALALDRVRVGVGGGLDEWPAQIPRALLAQRAAQVALA